MFPIKVYMYTIQIRVSLLYMSSKLPKATVAGVAEAKPVMKRPKQTAITDGTDAIMTLKAQYTAIDTM